MQPFELLSQLTDNLTTRRVYGEPYERDGVTIIPAAEVRGAGLLGRAAEPRAGEGGRLGLVARPVGAWVIKDGQARWQPAFDLTRVVARGQLLAIISILSLRSIVRHWRRAR